MISDRRDQRAALSGCLRGALAARARRAQAHTDPRVWSGAPEAKDTLLLCTTLQVVHRPNKAIAYLLVRNTEVRNTNTGMWQTHNSTSSGPHAPLAASVTHKKKTPTTRGVHPACTHEKTAGRARCCAPSPPSEPTSASTTLGPRPGASAACQRPHAASVAATSTPACARRHPVGSPQQAVCIEQQGALPPARQPRRRPPRARLRPLSCGRQGDECQAIRFKAARAPAAPVRAPTAAMLRGCSRHAAALQRQHAAPARADRRGVCRAGSPSWPPLELSNTTRRA